MNPEPATPLEQLTPEAYGTLVAGLSPPQRAALVGAVGGMVDGRENTLAALRRKGLVGGTPQTMQNLTALGWRLRAGLLVPPGTFGSAVVQALLDGGLPWQELPSGTLRRPKARIEAWADMPSAYVSVHALNGAVDGEGTDEAEALLRAAGFDVARTEGRSPRLLVAEGVA